MVAEHVQTKREIEGLLDQAGLRPRKRFGQHFLIDGNLMRLLAASAELSPDDIVLEVGPGTGGLTDLLVKHVRHVICVEIDRDLFEILSERFQNQANIELHCCDVLEGKHKLNPNVAEAIQKWSSKGAEESKKEGEPKGDSEPPGQMRLSRSFALPRSCPHPGPLPRGEGVAQTDVRGSSNREKEAPAEPLKLVANLPYDIATPLLMNLLVDYPAVHRFCFTVQAEVGERIASQAGSKIYGPLSIVTQNLCVVEQVARLGPNAFWPRPQVDSVMLRLDRRAIPGISGNDAGRFAEFVHGVFEHRRKTLRAALAYVVEERQRDRICATVDSKLRPEQIDPKQWAELFGVIND